MGLYRRKDSHFYWMKTTVNGKAIYQSTQTANKKQAERIYAKWITEIAEDKWFERQDTGRPLMEMIKRFEHDYTNCKGYYSKAWDKSIFKQFNAFFGEDATLQDVARLVGGYEQHRKAQGRASASITKELGLLRRMYNIAHKQWKWNLSNPVSEIELPKVKSGRVRYLNHDETKRLFEALEQASEGWLKPCVTIAIDTGLRLSNVLNLLWSEVNLSGKRIEISSEKMKNSDYIGIPLTETAVRTFLELQKVKSLSGHVFHDKGKQLYPVKVQRAFRRTLKAAEIGNFHFHDLRHTFASRLIQSGAALHIIARFLGHRDIRMTQRYAHLSVEELKDAIAVLDGKTTSSPLRFRYVEKGEDELCSVTP